ncbi:DNA primase [Patescibacteria group bacterium]|nr:DNA primase [Patescibacteria group bacterium]
MINSPIEEIKNKLNIVEVIGSYIKVQKAGANYRAVCPFHSEKKPSFFISPARQIWHCFGCGLGGDVFAFIKQIEGVEFGDALRILAQRTGVELKRENPKLRTERQRLYEICELTTMFFEKQLESKTGQEVKEYFSNRKVNDESIVKWRLGWSPDSWYGLAEFLRSKGYKNDELVNAGVVIKNDKGSYYDRFRNRIMFPIFDLNSQVVGFGGRIFKSEDTAKYVNTPSTLLYDKSKILYGLDKAKLAIRKNDACILTEGYVDVILAHQMGVENVVASSGTALTPYQLKILKRYSENLLTSFDMDIAGDTATKRGINLAQAQGFNIKVVVLPEDKDPADVISEKPENFSQAIKNAKGILDFYFDNAFNHLDSKTPEGKKEISKALLPIIKRIPNKIEQFSWLQKLAKKLEVSENVVEQELKKTKIEEDALGLELEEKEAIMQKPRKDLLEDRLIVLFMRSKSLMGGIDDNFYNLLSPQSFQIISCIKDDKKVPDELSETFNYLGLKADIEEDFNEQETQEEVIDCVHEIKALAMKEKLDKISQEIKKAELERNQSKIKELTEEFNKLAKQIL